MSSPVRAQEKTFSIAFYNVENLFDTLDNPLTQDEEFTPAGTYHYTNKIYHQKLNNIARVIADMAKEKDADGVDIIGFAEVENEKVLKELASQPLIRSRHYKALCAVGSDPRGINVGLLYNPGQFKLLGVGSLPVPVKELTRDILYVTGILGGDTVHLLVNHWPSRREGKEKTEPERKAAAAVNKKIIDSLLHVQKDVRIIVMGDFNDNPVDESIQGILAAGVDKHRLKENSLYNPFISIYQSGHGTVLYKKHWDLFDQVMLSYGLLYHNSLQFESAEIFKKDYLITQTGNFKGYPHRSFGGKRWINGYSDHLPVIIYLSHPNK